MATYRLANIDVLSIEVSIIIIEREKGEMCAGGEREIY